MSLARTKPTKKAAKKRLPKTPLEQFHSYWEQIERLERRLARKESDKALILDRFEREVRPLEEVQCQVIYRRVERLITFFGRKSITQWQRSTLADWIEHELKYLESNPFRGDLDLASLYKKVQQISVSRASEEEIEDRLEELRELIGEQLGIEVDVSDDELLACMHDPERISGLLQRLQAELLPEAFADDELDDETEGGGSESDEQYDDAKDDRQDPFERRPEELAEQVRLESLIGKSGLKVLYRRLALALHPDRAKGEEPQQARADLMVKLTEAWEHKDMFTLLTLAHDHLPVGEQFLSAENLAAINPLLERKIEDMKFELHNDWDNGISSLVYRRFMGSSNKSIDKAFTEHLDNLHSDITRTGEWLACITSLKALKPELEARWVELQSDPFDPFAFLFE